MCSLYKTPEGRRKVLASYERRLAALSLPVTSRLLPTRIGTTHVLLAGPTSAPALLLVHGANGDAVQMAAAYRGLTTEFRCVFVDVPGEPGRSSEARPPRGDDTLGDWMEELLVALELPDVALLGMSGGGYVCLRATATHSPRIRRVAVLVPEGLVPIGPMPEPTVEHADAFVQAITEPDCGFPRAAVQLMAASMRLVFETVVDPMHLGPVFSAADFSAVPTPVFVLAGGRDALFPGDAVVRRAKEIIPSLHEAIVIPQANHVHTGYFGGEAFDRMVEFLHGP